jgi:hypothetical protein
MPLWAWGFLLLMAAFFTFRFIASIKTGSAKASLFRYERQDEPFYFWFFVGLYFLGAVWCNGFLLLIIWHLLIQK